MTLNKNNIIKINHLYETKLKKNIDLVLPLRKKKFCQTSYTNNTISLCQTLKLNIGNVLNLNAKKIYKFKYM